MGPGIGFGSFAGLAAALSFGSFAGLAAAAAVLIAYRGGGARWRGGSALVPAAVPLAAGPAPWTAASSAVFGRAAASGPCARLALA
jgi:hypothetical protein